MEYFDFPLKEANSWEDWFHSDTDLRVGQNQHISTNEHDPFYNYMSFDVNASHPPNVSEEVFLGVDTFDPYFASSEWPETQPYQQDYSITCSFITEVSQESSLYGTATQDDGSINRPGTEYAPVLAVQSMTVGIPGNHGSVEISTDLTTVSRQSKRKRPSVELHHTHDAKAFKDANGSTAGVMIVFGTPKSQRSQYDTHQKYDTARTRKIGACQRCRKQKIRCGCYRKPYHMCEGCSKVKPVLLKLPCFLETLVDAQLFRKGPSVGHPFHFSRNNVYSLQDMTDDPEGFIQVKLTQGHGELTVCIARFSPQPGDKTALVGQDRSGRPYVTELPPYCLVRLEGAKQNMLKYIESSRDAYIEYFRCADEMTYAVFDEARRFAALDPDSTVSKALNLFAADRIIEKDWHLTGADECEIPFITDDEHPWCGKRPVTPMMDCQLDQIVIQRFLKDLRKDLLNQLQIDINTARREKWFEIFLTTFILLANAEQLLAHSRRNAIRHGAQGRYNSPQLATLYTHACKMLISHFHYVCNFKMSLAIDWKSRDIAEMAKLDAEQVDFLQRLQNRVRRESIELLNLRKGYKFEEPRYWTHQMMFEGWNTGDADMERFHIHTAPLICA